MERKGTRFPRYTPSRTSNFERVKKEASGRWAAIIGDLYPSLAPALVRPGHSRCACPIHGSAKGAKADGFRFFDDFHATGGGVCNTCGEFASGIDLICWLENATGKPEVALEILMDYLGIEDEWKKAKTGLAPKRKPRDLPPPVLVSAPAEDPKAIERRNALLSRVWSEGQPLSSLPDDHFAIRYFTETRGIDDVAIVKGQRYVRFHPNLYFARSDVADHPPITYPGIISMMHSDTGRGVGLHHIFLDHGLPKKAPVEKPKKILRRLERKLNGSIRLIGRTGFTHHANVCEGVETGMAICDATGQSVYAAGYATLLAAWNPPEGTRYVTVWCDRDEGRAGIEHAMTLQQRLHALGITSRILTPNYRQGPSEDWNDVHIEQGATALVEAYQEESKHTIYA